MSRRIDKLSLHLPSKFQGGGIPAILARGASGAFVVNMLGTGITFSLQILLARLLGADSYGEYIYTLTWINMLLLLGKLGLDTAALRFVSAYYGGSEWGLLRGFLRRSNQIALVASASVAVGTAGTVWLLQGNLSSELVTTFLVACLLLIVNVLLQMQSYSLVALKRVVLAQSPQAIMRPLLVAGGVIVVAGLAWPILSAPVVMAVNLMAATGALLLTRHFLKSSLPLEAMAARPQYLTGMWTRVGWSLALVSGLQLVLNQSDVIMIGFYLGTTDAGIYAAASRISVVILFGLNAVNTIAAPMFSEFYYQGRMGELQRIVTLAARGILVFSLPLCLVFIFGGEFIMGFFGKEFVGGAWSLAILALGQLVNASVGSVGFLMSMTGHQGRAAIVFGGSAILNVILNALLIPLWGINGAAIATATTTIIWNVILALYVWKRLGLRATAI